MYLLLAYFITPPYVVLKKAQEAFFWCIAHCFDLNILTRRFSTWLTNLIFGNSMVNIEWCCLQSSRYFFSLQTVVTLCQAFVQAERVASRKGLLAQWISCYYCKFFRTRRLIQAIGVLATYLHFYILLLEQNSFPISTNLAFNVRYFYSIRFTVIWRSPDNSELLCPVA